MNKGGIHFETEEDYKYFRKKTKEIFEPFQRAFFEPLIKRAKELLKKKNQTLSG